MRNAIRDLISSIDPLDQIEEDHIEFTLRWIASGKEIFRIAKPATPDTHLVSYFVVLDQYTNKLLLVDHKKALLWLPSGGHVEKDEHPAKTVRREAKEELGIEVDFVFDQPLFLTVAKTVGLTTGHTDVSLWYVLKGDSNVSLNYDREEFNTVRWFDLEDIPYDRSDPHMKRFIEKLRVRMRTSGSCNRREDR
jgi:8-oxo-dGTP pyrophosphatase MutT (NUDIX family)